MPLAQLFKRRNRDLFGHRLPPQDEADGAALVLAEDLRRLSERALRSGLDRSACLIEVAALIAELEGAQSVNR